MQRLNHFTLPHLPIPVFTLAGSVFVLIALLPTFAPAQEPATPESAAKVLDLRTFPAMENTKLVGINTLGIRMCQAPGTAKTAFAFQQLHLEKLGFKMQPGAYVSENSQYAHSTKEGFQVAVSVDTTASDPASKGMANITLVNKGNVALDKLPVPPGTKLFYKQYGDISYLTEAKVAETAAACRALLLAAGWEPYGEAGNDADSKMHYYKRNAIKLQCWVSLAPAQGNKTMLRYDTDLLTVDIPVPPEANDPRYTDTQKRLDFAAEKNQLEAVFAFYVKRLGQLGWQPTTDHPITDEKKQFLVFRNAQKDLLMLDILIYNDKIDVKLEHQTAAEFAEEERLAKIRAEEEKIRLAKENMKTKVAISVLPGATDFEKSADSLFEFTLPSGSGPTALTAYRDQLVKEGWKETAGTEFKKFNGELELTKDTLSIDMSYFDNEITGADIRVSGSNKIVFEISKPAQKPVAEAPKAKPAQPKIPGIPELPPGVVLPPDVQELLKKSFQSK